MVSANEYFVTKIAKDTEPTCWGCGLRLILPSNTRNYKCGWCGAVTGPVEWKHEGKCFRWRRVRDRCFVCILFGFMLFVICGGVWAAYPIIFSINYLSGIFHIIVTVLLSVSTISTFCLSAFRCAGKQPLVQWGSYPTVGKGDLANYTFCHYCSKPKSPDTHHCRTCQTCILDMDHHCPFIGNCVGAGNHRYFVAFLISAVVGTIYVAIMSLKTGLHIWPPLPPSSIDLNGSDFGTNLGTRILKEAVIAFLISAAELSTRGLVLLYLFISSVTVNIGLSLLLWQQLCFIYEGTTYLSNLSSQEQGGDAGGEKDCKNISRFFGCPYSVSRILPIVRDSHKKIHNK